MVKALGWTLLHFVWEAALIALLLAAMLFVYRPAPARLRYAAASLALMAMPLIFGLTLTRELSAPPAVRTGPLRLLSQPDAPDAPVHTRAAQQDASPVWRWA